MERGTIHSIDRYKQPISFAGLQFERGITPTDFDCVIDFASKEWVLVEFKQEGNPVSRGQRLCLESALKAHLANGIAALGIIAVHNTQKSDIVDAKTCRVAEIWINGNWKQVKNTRQVREVIDSWRKWNGA